MNPPPIFIVGAPRSGTTLLRQMLNRHPGIAICGETHFLEIACQERRRRAFGDLSDAGNRERLIKSYLSTRRAHKQLQMDLVKLAERLRREGTGYREMFASILTCYAESTGKHRCGEKTPRHSLFVETLCDWFPGALILHILRDPRDVVASLRHVPFGSPSAVLNARMWLQFNLAARRISHRPEYLEVRYETLIAQPEDELRRICRFIGEEYSPAQLMPERAEVKDSAAMDRFLTPLTSSRVGVWRQQLTPAEAAQIEWALRGQLEAFGYKPEMPAASAMTILRGAGFAAFDIARMALQRFPALWYDYLAPGDLVQYERWRYPQETGARVRTRSEAKSIQA